MRKRTIWSAVLAATLVLPAALAAPAVASPSTAFGVSAISAVSAVSASSPIADQLIAGLPAARAAAEATRARLGLDDSPLRSAVLDVIDPTQYDCPTANPPVLDAISAGIQDWTADQRLAAVYAILFDIPMTEAAYLSTPGPYTFGAKGAYSKKATQTFKDLKRFWDIKSYDIQLVPAHGRMLLNQARVTKVFTTIYGQPADLSANTAAFIAAQVDTPALKFGDHPIFTFNAYANSSEGVPTPGIGLVPDRIVMGDGVLDGFALVGLGDVTTQAIIGHEFGHHIQYEDGLFQSTLPAPEATRRTELMADAFSAYFLTHRRGDNMHWRRVQQFVQMFAQIGDCGFSAPSHHGTPNQRTRAALWGFGVAESARRQGVVLPSRVFAARFETVLPALVAPDAD
ncbi:hypothetical protein [Streptomyces sp. SID13031]|uniref:hypothetical protein n=1 Tax=Streptomyces sp. SID13031 TaxID=2706046 RepID=UPI0013C86233|nr:hypothetical protein [Streptomyces sp. SID13031]NEA34846.1 hypothetical protein [Streptomyces sp. SID13031]